MAWDGIPRRSTDGRATDHDTLIEVVQILKTHVDNFSTHTKEDADNFKLLNRTMWICTGAVTAVGFIFKFSGR